MAELRSINNLVVQGTGLAADEESLSTVELMLREGKKPSLEQAMYDWVNFCAENEIEGTIHDNAWTDTRLGMQKISAYDIYNMMDEIKRGLLNAKQKGITQNKQKLLK